MKKSNIKPGMVTTELAISIALAIVVLIVVVGLFNDNLSSMVASSKLSNLFNGDSSKTEFSNFNSDYTDSQINVQITGEQGLQQLRRIANNKAIALIENPFSPANSNGDSIGYLALVIKSIVGSPDICVNMDKDSDKYCDYKDPQNPADNIGGFNYKVAISGTKLAINKVDPTGTNVLGKINLTMDSPVSSVFNSVNININTDGSSALTANQQYDFISHLPDGIESYINGDVVLMKSAKTFKNAGNVNFNPLLTGPLADISKSGIKDFVYKDKSSPAGYSTNNVYPCWTPPFICKDINKDANVARKYIMYGPGKKDIFDGFSGLLTSVNHAAKENAKNYLGNTYSSKIIEDAAKYAYKATYNKFIFNDDNKDSTRDVPTLSSVSFYDNGEADFSNGQGRIKGQSRICYTYNFAEGSGNNRGGNPEDWDVLVVAYADPSQVVSTYLKYFKLYCKQHSS